MLRGSDASRDGGTEGDEATSSNKIRKGFQFFLHEIRDWAPWGSLPCPPLPPSLPSNPRRWNNLSPVPSLSLSLALCLHRPQVPSPRIIISDAGFGTLVEGRRRRSCRGAQGRGAWFPASAPVKKDRSLERLCLHGKRLRMRLLVRDGSLYSLLSLPKAAEHMFSNCSPGPFGSEEGGWRKGGGGRDG